VSAADLDDVEREAIVAEGTRAEVHPIESLDAETRARLERLLCAPDLQFSTFARATDNRPKPDACAWPTFVARIERAASSPRPTDKKALAMFSPARFSGPRSNKSVTEISALVADLDHVEVLTLQNALEALQATGVAFVAHETFSAKLNSTGRTSARLVVPLSRAVPAIDWEQFRPAALAELELTELADHRAKDASRSYFTPCANPDGSPAGVTSSPGEPLDVEPVIARGRVVQGRTRAPAPPSETVERARAAREQARPCENGNRPDRVVRARAWLERADPAVSGSGGHATAFRVVERVVRGFELTDPEAVAALAAWNARCDGPWSDGELLHKVIDGREHGDTPIGELLSAEREREPPRTSDHAPEPRPAPSSEAPRSAAGEPETPNARPAWPTIREQLTALVGQGEPIETGIETLDTACRGGLRRGRVIVIAGPPGACKTTLSVMVGHDLAARGVHVAVLAADEGALGLVVRIGQLVGEDRDALERADAFALERVALASESTLATLAIVDASTPGASIGAIAHELATRAASATGVLIVDSIQSIARAPAYEAHDGMRARVDAVLVDLRAAAARGLVVIAASEVSRIFYSGRGGTDAPPDPLAAAKESGGVEYAADALIVLSSVPGEHGTWTRRSPRTAPAPAQTGACVWTAPARA
jgi:archaellum biogenesis ATPase FlaH